MEIYGENDSFHTYEAGGACSACSYILPRLVDSAPHYFENGYVVCQKCGEKVDTPKETLNKSCRKATLLSGAKARVDFAALTARLRKL
jgi:hypothetical protein